MSFDERCLVTGAGGFIGSHLVERLLAEGSSVVAFVHYNSRGSLGWLEEIRHEPRLRIVAGDIRDYDMVAEAMKGCERVYHLAALIGIPYSYVSPLAYVKTNVEGTYNVLQAARMLGVGRIVVTSTSEVYGTAQQVPISENHPINPQSPYAATKASADYLARSFYLSFGLPVAIIRPFNTFGPRQSARAVIPTIITQVLSGQTDIRLGNLEATRDFNYVDDTVSAFLSVGASDLSVGMTMNAGTGRETSIADVVHTVATLTRKEVHVTSDEERVRPKHSEVMRLVCDSSLLRKTTGWSPTTNLESGLKQTVDWISRHLDIYKEDVYNV
jgi:dTDP-glucose 4,6-dehydratase